MPAPMPPAMMPGADPSMGAMPGRTAQVIFSKPESMQVRLDLDGSGMFESVPLIVPARYNFVQGGIYRMKLTNIEGREGVELYPTLEIGAATARSEAFLARYDDFRAVSAFGDLSESEALALSEPRR